MTMASGLPLHACDNADYPRPFYAWTVVAILIATAILSYTDRQVLSLLVDPMRSDLGIGDTEISLLLGTAFAVVYGVAGIPLGYIADRTSRRNLIFAGVVIWSLGTIACGLSNSFVQIFTSRIFVGLGEAVLSPAAISLISDYFPPSRRGVAVGFFLSGIAMGSGAAILIGGGVLHSVDSGLLAATPLAGHAPWRLVLLLIGMPGLFWSLVIFVVREPLRRVTGQIEQLSAPGATDRSGKFPSLARAAPIYIVVATASLVDNAVGAWAPSLLIREFAKDPAQIGIELGLLLTAGFGGGVLIGGVLADRARAAGGLPSKLRVCLISSLLILPASFLMNAGYFPVVLTGVPLYFALSGIVTAVGFSAILDIVPNRSRGLAMSISFFLNVAVGAGVGPTAVALSGTYIFGEQAGLGPPLSFTAIAGYLVVIVTILFAQMKLKNGIRT
jgi:MFS family permease